MSIIQSKVGAVVIERSSQFEPDTICCYLGNSLDFAICVVW